MIRESIPTEPEAEPALVPQANSAAKAAWDADHAGAMREALQHAKVEEKRDVRGNRGLDLRVSLTEGEVMDWSQLQLIKPISTGSFGEVYLARCHGLGDVSVKRCLLNADGSMTKEQLCNLEREINTYRILNHPNIVKYHGCVLSMPNLAIVTEYLPNGNLFDLLFMQRVNLHANSRLKIAREVSVAVGYMHNCDPTVIHRDLKTQNLVLDANWSIKVCDFGKTQAMSGDQPLSSGQDTGGSPRYMAPECFNPGAYITEKVDIWSLGCCLVEILGGPLPYEDVPAMSEVQNLILQGRGPGVPHWFSPKVKPMLAGCFDFDPNKRISSTDVQLALRYLTPEELERHGMDKRRTQ